MDHDSDSLGSPNHTTGDISATSNSKSANERVPANERIRNALAILRKGKISLLDFLAKVLDPSEKDYASYRDRMYTPPKDGAPRKLDRVFDLILSDPRGGPLLTHWMGPHAIKMVSRKIYDEMDDVKDELRGTIDTITSAFLLQWDINSTVTDVMDNNAPILNEVLECAAQTDRARKENTLKTCNTARNVVVTQLARQRSHFSVYFAAPFTLFLWTNGASRQTIEALAQCGLCVSFPSLFKLLKNLASQSVARALQVAQGPHILCYDNINISTSIFVEQRSAAPAKVQSGTFPIIYE
ncbi:hypothetical protein HYDPIDRAFT_171701, partial [Hydnomerulius pinastri MD-312]